VNQLNYLLCKLYQGTRKIMQKTQKREKKTKKIQCNTKAALTLHNFCSHKDARSQVTVSDKLKMLGLLHGKNLL